MPQKESVFEELSSNDFAKIKANAETRHYSKDDTIFSEGDSVDYIYFIESGRVSIRIQKFTEQEEICSLGPSEYFGEMAVFYRDRRTATAIAASDSALLRVDKNTFLEIVRNDESIGANISKILSKRNEELILKEKLIESTGIKGKTFHVSIKGDPSIRESTFTRERYESIVDKVLPELSPMLIELLLNRCVYEIFIHFNSGEIRVSSVFNPFSEEIHQANKLTDEAYIDRHFPKIAYQEKVEIIKRYFGSMANEQHYLALDDRFKTAHGNYYKNWEPVPPEEIRDVLSSLSVLRSLEDFYLRNFTISMTREAMRMQFNCDGTHFVSADDYRKFLQQNLISE
ncbi:MAG: hypothetical protein BMS9Abin11_0103 [Gammaproteobacteria bacterium]|nr:MAG: hypothetical protein BMS9Abin11_0103 [Gammaproteobacteria bacterium]